jgi:O-antigen ligase
VPVAINGRRFDSPVELAAGTVRRPVAIAWLIVAVVTMLLTRSATITVALVIVAIVAAAALLMRRLPRRAHLGAGIAMLALAAGAVVAAVLLRGPLLGLLGRSDDLTNRIDIWEKVIGLAQERPVAGWGWVSYWAPWVSPFDDLLEVNGVQVMHAHNAWLDVWLQLGILGLIVFGALVLSTAARAWLTAVDAPQAGRRPLPQTAVTLLPLLLLTAILVQSLAESRLLVEYGWALLVIVAVKTRTDTIERDAAP